MHEKIINLGSKIKDILISNDRYASLTFKSIDSKFNVILSFDKPIDASVRGPLLLDLETVLNDCVDKRIRLWCDVAHDKSKLRQLRGIKIGL